MPKRTWDEYSRLRGAIGGVVLVDRCKEHKYVDDKELATVLKIENEETQRTKMRELLRAANERKKADEKSKQKSDPYILRSELDAFWDLIIARVDKMIKETSGKFLNNEAGLRRAGDGNLSKRLNDEIDYRKNVDKHHARQNASLRRLFGRFTKKIGTDKRNVHQRINGLTKVVETVESRAADNTKRASQNERRYRDARASIGTLMSDVKTNIDRLDVQHDWFTLHKKDQNLAEVMADPSSEKFLDIDVSDQGPVVGAVVFLRKQIKELEKSLGETDSVVDRQGSKLDQIEDDLAGGVSEIENQSTNVVEQVVSNTEVNSMEKDSGKRSWLPWIVVFLLFLVLAWLAHGCVWDLPFSVDSVGGTSSPAVVSLKQAEDACEHGLASYDSSTGAFSCIKPAPAAAVGESFIQQDVELPSSGSVAPVKCELDKIGTWSELPGGPHRIEIGGHGIQHVDFYPAVGVKAVSFIVPNIANPEGVPAIWHGYGSIWEGQLDECGSFNWVADATEYAMARLDSGHSGIVVDLRSGKIVANVGNISADDIDDFLVPFYAVME